MTKLDECQILDLATINDARGNLTVVESNRDIPFAVARAYWLYDVPGGASRGGHAHKQLQQLIVAVSGSFDVILDDGRAQRTFSLNRSHYGLFVPRMVWRELTNFSSGSVCVVLASEHFDESDYYRDHGEFVAAAAALS